MGSNWKRIVAFGLGSGCAPVAPGTFGTLAALPLCIVLMWLPVAVHVVAIAIVFVIGVRVSRDVSAELGKHDHGAIVIDEWAGMMLTLLMIPLNWWTILAGFVLFRLFDIWKPWPIRSLDRRVHGGLGIMLDDVAAGCAANVTLQLLLVGVERL